MCSWWRERVVRLGGMRDVVTLNKGRTDRVALCKDNDNKYRMRGS